MSGVGFHGCIKDRHDDRDIIKSYENAPSTLEHPSVDLRPYVDHVYDQGQLNSCTANAMCAAYGFDLKKQSQSPHARPGAFAYFDPSRLFVYYNARSMEKTVLEDSGASIRDTIKCVHRFGVCKEATWRYDIHKFYQQPPESAYREAHGNIVSKYERLQQDIHQFRACLKDNCPFLFSFEVFGSFYNIDCTGLMKMPLPLEYESPPIGRHAVMAVGYDDRSKNFIILNSWGQSWGDKGYFYMPYDYIKDCRWSSDFWKITFVQEAPARPTARFPVTSMPRAANLWNY